MTPRKGAFTRAEYQRFMDPAERRFAYGEIEWSRERDCFIGAVTLNDESGPTDFQIRVNPYRPDEMTLLVRFRSVHIARIDVNGWHRFSDGLRRSTHLQAHANGSDLPCVTTDLGSTYPLLSLDGYPDLDTQRKQCVIAAETHLNIDFAGIAWMPVPMEGGVR